jgi:hypothetical protein
VSLTFVLGEQVSAGGLVSALMGVSNFRTCWVGWPGAHLRYPRAHTHTASHAASVSYP